MKRRDVTLALAASALAPVTQAQGGPVEGKHYVRLAQPLPATPGKIEVVEFFVYLCPHCFAFDPLLEAWLQQQSADVSFRRVPTGSQARLRLHQRMFYALEAMGALSPTVHAGIFNAFHRDNVEANDEAAVIALVGRLGIDQAKFKQLLGSPIVQARAAQGMNLADHVGANSVPALLIGGRWRTGPGMAGAKDQDEAVQGRQALAVADFLIKQIRGNRAS